MIKKTHNFSEKIQFNNIKATKRGQEFINAINISTLPKAFNDNAYIPAMLILNGKLTTPRYGGQESYLTFQILPDGLDFGSSSNPKEHLKVPLSNKYTIDISVIKRPTLYLSFPTVEIYVLLTILDQDKSYRILWSDFPDLLDLINYLEREKINYEIPDDYLSIFQQTNTKQLQRDIETDNRFASKLIPSLPPATQPYPMVHNE